MVMIYLEIDFKSLSNGNEPNSLASLWTKQDDRHPYLCLYLLLLPFNESVKIIKTKVLTK